MRTLAIVLLLSAAWTARADEELTAEDSTAVEKWMIARAAAAKSGQAELVRFPLVHHGTWGSNYPTYYIGLNDTSAPGDNCPCVSPTFAKGAEEPPTLEKDGRDKGAMYVVEGRFTGAFTKAPASDDPSDKHTFKVWGFEVLRWRTLRDGDANDAKVRIVLAGKDAAADVKPLADDKPWLVVIDSLALFDKGTDVRAEALRAKVAAAGFADAQVIDSRQAPLLFCCYRVIVASRQPTREAALAQVKALKQKKIGASVRRGW